jgi:hypothetical protein
VLSLSQGAKSLIGLRSMSGAEGKLTCFKTDTSLSISPIPRLVVVSHSRAFLYGSDHLLQGCSRCLARCEPGDTSSRPRLLGPIDLHLRIQLSMPGIYLYV